MPTGIPIRDDQEWIKFNVCYDNDSKQYAVRHECKVCSRQTMSEGLANKNAVGDRITILLKAPVCQKCLTLFEKYKAAMETVT